MKSRLKSVDQASPYAGLLWQGANAFASMLQLFVNGAVSGSPAQLCMPRSFKALKLHPGVFGSNAPHAMHIGRKRAAPSTPTVRVIPRRTTPFTKNCYTRGAGYFQQAGSSYRVAFRTNHPNPVPMTAAGAPLFTRAVALFRAPKGMVAILCFHVCTMGTTVRVISPMFWPYDPRYVEAVARM
jgi:hypothetical protein